MVVPKAAFVCELSWFGGYGLEPGLCLPNGLGVKVLNLSSLAM